MQRIKDKKQAELEKALKMQELEWKWTNKRESGFPAACEEEDIRILEESISDLKKKLSLNRGLKRRNFSPGTAVSRSSLT